MAQQQQQQQQKTLAGTCLCGNLSYTSTAAASHLDNCYCLTCQKASGEPYIAFAGIPKEAITWSWRIAEPFTWRPTILDSDISVSERASCGNCGCNVSIQYDLYPDKTHVNASTIKDCDFAMPALGVHIWTKHVPAGYQIPDDGVPRYEEFDGIFEATLEEFLRRKRS